MRLCEPHLLWYGSPFSILFIAFTSIWILTIITFLYRNYPFYKALLTTQFTILIHHLSTKFFVGCFYRCSKIKEIWDPRKSRSLYSRLLAMQGIYEKSLSLVCCSYFGDLFMNFYLLFSHANYTHLNKYSTFFLFL